MTQQETAKRSIAKTISWRLVATGLIFFTVWLFTGAFYVSLASSIVAGVINTAAYYMHERLWNRVRWGREGR